MTTPHPTDRGPPRLQLAPMTLRQANAFVATHHRHHKPVQGQKFSIGAALIETIVGVAIVGRPVRATATTVSRWKSRVFAPTGQRTHARSCTALLPERRLHSATSESVPTSSRLSRAPASARLAGV